MESLVNFALQYAKRGFSVIPTLGKRPLIKFADREALTLKEIKSFWELHPYANIALKTDKFFVIDVDQHLNGPDGIQTIKELNHPEWFDTLCQRTAHNGYQYFFTKPPKNISQNIGFLPGVDVKAHPNNYVVVAPSAIYGKAYKWLNHKPMVQPSEGLIQLIEEKSRSTVNNQKLQSFRPHGQTQTSKLFEQVANGLGPTGGRNNALAAFSGGLLFRSVNPECVLELARIANDRTEDSLPDKEVVATVNSMIRKEIRRRQQFDD